MTYDHRKNALHITIVILLLAALMLILPANTFAASGTEGKALVNAPTGLNLRKSASMKGEKIAVLADDTELTILKEVYKSKTSTKKSKVWYKVKADGKTGYVRADNVDNISYPAVSATVSKKTAFRKGPGTKMKKKGTLKKGTDITVYIDANPVKSTKGSSKTWYRISVDGKKGYVCSKNVKLGNAVSTASAPGNTGNDSKNMPNDFSKMTSEQFEAYLSQQGFPDSYKPGLRKLHAAHPNWAFTALKTGVSWTDAMKSETKYKRSLVSKSFPKSYRSTSKDSFSSYSMTAESSSASGALAAAPSAASFEEVKSAAEKSGTVTGTVKNDAVKVFDSMNADAAVIKDLDKGSTVSIRSAVTSQDNSQKWYEIEIIIDKASDGVTPVYADAEGTEDKDLDAANDAAEKAMLEAVDPDDEEIPDAEDLDDDEASDEVVEGSIPVTAKGYVKAGEIEVFLGDGLVTESEDGDDTDEAEEETDAVSDDNSSVDPVTGPTSEEQSEEEKIAQDVIMASDTSSFTSDAESLSSEENDGLEHVTSGDAKNAYYQIEKGWYNASAYVVAYFMDPRNFLSEDRVYMFEDLSYRSEYQTAAAVDKIIGPTKLAKYGFTTDIFMKAGKNNGVSPVFLAARVVQETGGNSASVNGSKSGGTVVYNPFNIGAAGKNAVSKGLAYAKKQGWTTPEKAVNGAASYIASGYINKKQNTLYFQKFNVANGISKLGTHQYMTNVMAPYSEAYITKKSYVKMGVTNEPLAFVIPVFSGMPEKTKLP